jgi:hypothetical protein
VSIGPKNMIATSRPNEIAANTLARSGASFTLVRANAHASENDDPGYRRL